MSAKEGQPTTALPFNLSMMKVFSERIKTMDQFVSIKVRELDVNLVPWDPSVLDHSPLLVSSKTLKDDLEKWRKSHLQLMQALWLEQTKRFGDYRNSVSDVLLQRHLGELEVSYPNLRFIGEGSEKEKSTLSVSQQECRDHLTNVGYRYERDNIMLNRIAERQISERKKFEDICKKQHSVLREGCTTDIARLTKALSKVVDNGTRCLHITDQRISLSHQSGATPNLYKKYQPQGSEVGRQDSTVLPNADPGGPNLPVGSLLDRYNRESRTSSAAAEDIPRRGSLDTSSRDEDSRKPATSPSQPQEEEFDKELREIVNPEDGKKDLK